MDKHIRSYLEQSSLCFSFPELSFGMLHGDKEPDVFESSKTRFPTPLYKVGSLTKVVTALAVLLLCEDGLIDLSDKVSKHLRWFNNKLSSGINPDITIADLLLHTSALPRGNFSIKDPPVSEVKLSIKAIQDPLKTGAPCIFKYSNLGYILLGLVIQKNCKKKYAAFVKERIFDPLGMEQSGFGVTSQHGKLTAAHGLSYFSDNNKTPYDFTKIPMYGAPHASFDMFSSITDMLKLIGCILNNGMLNGKVVWQQKTISLLFDKKHPISGTLASGMGILSMKVFNETIFFQDGEHWGHCASLLMVPPKKMAFIAMTNRGSAGLDLSFITRTIARYCLFGKDLSLLNYEYHGEHQMVGEFRSATGQRLTITKHGTDMLVSFDNEQPTRLIYKGRGAFLQLDGALSKYVISQDIQQDEMVGLCVGPMYFGKQLTKGHAEPVLKYADLTGIYRNASAGRVALFERDDKLILAYSPFKEVILKQVSTFVFAQTDGPFVNEALLVKADTGELTLGQLVFKKTNKYY